MAIVEEHKCSGGDAKKRQLARGTHAPPDSLLTLGNGGPCFLMGGGFWLMRHFVCFEAAIGS